MPATMNTDRKDIITAIVLAAGPSSRLGQAKQLLQVDGYALTSTTCRLSASGYGGVATVPRPSAVSVAPRWGGATESGNPVGSFAPCPCISPFSPAANVACVVP